jgi:HNH endonuclease
MGLRGVKPSDPIVRFMPKIQVSDEAGLLGACWLWTGSLRTAGYGAFWVPGRGHMQAHRFAYEFWVGPIPEGFEMDHLCHNADPTCGGGRCAHRRCVNPDHIEPVSHLINVQRGTAGRAQKARQCCPQGHSYDKKNTGIVQRYDRVGPRVFRQCKLCNLIASWRRRGKSAEEIAERLALREVA